MHNPLKRDDEAAPLSTPTPTSSVRPRAQPTPLRPNRGQPYAELEGGQGREVFFRPHRYQREDLGPVCPTVQVVLTSSSAELPITRECVLHDVSQNGVAFEWPTDQPIDSGTVIAELTVRFDGHKAYAGPGRVGSVRQLADKTIVGASFTDGLMNIHDVL